MADCLRAFVELNENQARNKKRMGCVLGWPRLEILSASCASGSTPSPVSKAQRKLSLALLLMVTKNI